MLTVYEIILPVRDNSGIALHMAHKAYARFMVTHFGGFTESPCAGVWVDGSPRAKLYRDESIRYQVAADHDIRDTLVNAAAVHFPDQVCFYVARIGEAEIRDNPKA